MKKILLTLPIILLVLFTVCTAVSAASEKDWTKEGEFITASFHYPKKHTNDKDAFESAVFAISENSADYNIKYVSFLGKLTNGSEHTYKSVVTEGKKTLNDLKELHQSDTKWNSQWRFIKSTVEIFKEVGLPYGLTYDVTEIYTGGAARSRDSSQSVYFLPEDIMPDEAKFGALDEANYYTIVENNGIKYIIFQLEIFPREATLNWFNETLAKHTDKYAIVYTASFSDQTGELNTMWNWETEGVVPKGTSRLKGFAIAHYERPRDGAELWNYAFAKHDNILAVICTSHNESNQINTKVLTTNNGYSTVAVNANPARLEGSNGPYVLMTKISADNKTITFRYFSPIIGYIDSSEVKVELPKIASLTEPLIMEGLPTINFQQNGANKSYILGYEGNTFRPNANMTRAEACTIFARLLLNTNDIPDGYTTRFEDVKEGDWFYNAVAYLDDSDFFYRNKSTAYKPNEPITRAEFVELAHLASTLKSKGKSASFTDVPKDHFYYDSIVAAAESGLVNGYEDSTFRPDNTITRAEVVTVVNRLLSLAVNEDTVIPDKLDNTFVDINGHWARLNILMAANSNVQTQSSYNASLDGVNVEGALVIFENKHVKISINKKNGNVTEIINLATGENIVKSSSNSPFIYLTVSGNKKSYPVDIALVQNRIKVTFKNGAVLYFIADIHDDYMAFELDSELPSAYSSVTFASLTTNLEMLDAPNSYRLGTMAMTANVFSVNYGMGYSNNTYATVYSKYDSGTIGSKHGFVLSTLEMNDDYLRQVSDAIDRSKGLANTTGGPYTQVSKDTAGDYIIITNTSEENFKGIIEKAKEFNIDQIDIHHGLNSFRQGDFYFHNTKSGTAKEFGDTIGKLAKDNGIKLGLHVYAYYIDYNAKAITADPKWQKQLEKMDDVYTLRSDLKQTTTNIKTEEDASGFDTTETFFYKNSRYILIDQEIIYVGSGTPSGFINCRRAQCGTKYQKHTKGAKIYHLSGYFSRFVPEIGSELFYHMADLTAQAYNDGGFSMIYLDAIDGLSHHTGDINDTYYYYHMYTQRILSQCKTDPIIEFSAVAPQMWNVRGRMGAWDIPTRGYKAFVNAHLEENLKHAQYNFTTSIGWFHFFPDSSPESGMRNVIHKTLFKDDIDYMGSLAVMHNMSNVLYTLNPKSVDENPEYRENLAHYTFYNTIRKSGYFTEEAKQKAIEHGGEFKIIEKASGEYAFLEMYYNKKNVGNAANYNTFIGNNPFKAQEPFIRIEGKWSTLSENELIISEFDENKTLAEQSLNKNINVDMSNNMVMKFRAKGTGVDGDAMLISLTGGITSGESGGRIDYFVDLNFEGWREFIILEADSGEYDFNKYVFDGIKTSGMQYATYRVVPTYKNIVNLTIRTCGKSATSAQIGTIKAYTQVEAPVKNPTVTVGNSSITFNTTLKGSEYLEYDPVTRKAQVHHADQSITEVTDIKGKLEIPAGAFNGTYTATAETSAPVRARVVLGFLGQEITN